MDNDKNISILNINNISYKTRLSKKFTGRKRYAPVDPKMIFSFIPGTVLDILVKEGQPVSKGDDLMILDAMKMQNKLKSPVDGKIRNIPAKKGDKVSKGTLLIELD